MKLRVTILTAATLLVLAVLATGCSTLPESANAAQPNAVAGPTTSLPFAAEKARTHAAADPITVAAGTLVNISLQQSISSASAESGQEFAAVLDEPLVANGRTLAPRGAAVTGRVVAARSSGHMHKSGYLRLALASIVIDGKAVPVHSSSIFAMGGAHKKRNIALIGGGAGAGALIGAIAGGGKGALIGSLVGAGAGTAGAYATGKKEVAFGAERRLTFRLTQPLVLRN